MKHQPLTPREHEVLQFVWEGFSTREIANKLGRSYNTIAMYRQQIRSKFGVTTTAAALKIALREGILVEKK
ncbi:MAG: response regulator transcription factor [Nitrospiraceae bacterium]